MLTSFLFPSSQRSECQAREAKWCLVCLFMFCFAEIRSHCVVIQSHPPPASASSVLEGQAGTATAIREVTFHWHTFLNPQLVIFTSDSPVALQYRQALCLRLTRQSVPKGLKELFTSEHSLGSWPSIRPVPLGHGMNTQCYFYQRPGLPQGLLYPSSHQA